uniref:DUF5034 domain-containing protein n=1 Tax=Roseihalotalea indica TaxID=2867963 RepID=A0AA49GQ81_9BACT|nr:hypothetical protein K4G66_07300 [Tunicatimonas sp. TK19036]
MKDVLRVSLTLLLLLNVGCSGGDDCGSFKEQFVDIEGLTGANVALGGSYSNFVELGEGATVAYTEFGIRAMPETTYRSETAEVSGGFQAFACSPPAPQPSEEIADIAVFSSSPYAQASSSKVFAAGDTLNSIIKIYEPYSGRIVGLPDLFMDENLMASDYPFTLQLVSEPREAAEHQFTVHYRLTNGEFYQFTTDAITITP